eukprot:TRINITY_DN170_c1_g1_i2.p1 TRINITY_DN170_c1_g1~~TRINITY_DN170_c1_g1_i2.p1  ORF type:complete len:525 (-),score=39.23 TRINITY_DN170_c1_g1_i2:714-2288(-)
MFHLPKANGKKEHHPKRKSRIRFITIVLILLFSLSQFFLFGKFYYATGEDESELNQGDNDFLSTQQVPTKLWLIRPDILFWIKQMTCSLKLILAIILSLSISVQARIWNLYFSKDDRPLILLTRPFGYAKNGKLKIEVSKVEVFSLDKGPNAQYEQYSFILAPDNAIDAQLPQLPSLGNCSAGFRSDDYIQLFNLTRFDDKEPPQKISHNTTIPEGGQYLVYFKNCNHKTPISFKVRIEMFNKGDSRNNYLSVGEVELPAVYFMFFLFYVAGGIWWVFVVIQQRANALKVHHLMTVLVVFKALTLLCQWGMYHYMSLTGHPEGWNIAFYVFTFFRGVFFFTVIVLVGTGWSYLKPFLGDNERRILMVVIPLQIFANIAIVVLDENTPAERSFGTWRDIFHLVDIVCCCAVLFPIVWSINHLRDAAQTDGKAAASMQKLALFRQFYVMVVVYIYFTRIVVYLLQTMVPYQYSWTSKAADELGTLVFYTLTAVKFMPSGQNPYFALDTMDFEIDMQEMVPTSSKFT